MRATKTAPNQNMQSGAVRCSFISPNYLFCKSGIFRKKHSVTRLSSAFACGWLLSGYNKILLLRSTFRYILSENNVKHYKLLQILLSSSSAIRFLPKVCWVYPSNICATLKCIIGLLFGVYLWRRMPLCRRMVEGYLGFPETACL